MFTNLTSILPKNFSPPNLHEVNHYLDSLNFLLMNVTSLIFAKSAIVSVNTGQAILFRKRNAKTLSSFLLVLLLVLTLTTVIFVAFEPRNTEAAHYNELQIALPGTTGYSIFQLPDGNYIVNTVDESNTFLVKLDASYNLLWSKTIKIDNTNTILDRLIPTSDGGYALGGIIDNEYFLMKTDRYGDAQWIARYYSEDAIIFLRALIQTSDDGFALAGFGEMEEEGLGWIWFAKTDAYGIIQWNETFSGPVADCPSAIIQTSDGGYILSDVSYSYIPDQGFFRLIKMDPYGKVLWNTTYGGEGRYIEPECNLAIATKDGGYLMGGYLWDTDAWVVKTDSEGKMQWNQTYGNRGSSITSILEIENGNYLLGSISDFHAAGIIIIDNTGNKLWNITFPEVTWTIGYESNYNTIIHSEDDHYLMVGSKNQSVWLAKLTIQTNNQATLHSIKIASLTTATIMIIAFLLAINKRKPSFN